MFIYEFAVCFVRIRIVCLLKCEIWACLRYKFNDNIYVKPFDKTIRFVREIAY